jgi:hypothetical protein
MPPTYVDPRIYGEISDEEKAFKMRQLYPQMFVNSTDPNYPGGFGQNIDYDNLPAEEGDDPSALGKAGMDVAATATPVSSPVGSPGTAGGGDAATKLASEMGPNSPAAANVPPSFVEKYGGWGGEPQGGAATTADGTVDPMGGWGGTPNATPPAPGNLRGPDLVGAPGKPIDQGIYREAQDKGRDEGINRQPPPNAGKDEGIYMGGPLGVPDTTPTPATATAGPPMAIPKSSGMLTSPTGALGSIVPALREPALPRTVPPAPARRLQPPQDRVALYQKLRPYPGMSRSEKMSNMIAAAFASAAQPGTGNDFKDAARAFAQGNVAYQGIKDQDRATRANYANSVLGQLAAQEEAERKGIDTEADVYKKGGEGYRAYSYGGFLGDRGQHMLTQLGPAAIMNAESARTVANTAAEKAKNEVTTASEGSGVYQRDANGVVVRRDLVPKTFAPPAAEAKIDANVRAMYIYEQLNGGPLTAEQSTAAWRAMNDMDPKVVGGGGALAQSIRIGNIQDPVERKRQTDLLLQAGSLAQKVSPPAPYVQHS